MNLQDMIIQNEEIVVDDASTFNAIGKQAVLEACTVRIRVPAKCLSIEGRLVDTTLIVERPLSGFSWLDARLERCTFHGTFKDNEFGTTRSPTW